MAKQQWKPGNMLYPLPAVLVTVADRMGKENVFTVAWTGTVCTVSYTHLDVYKRQILRWSYWMKRMKC